MFFIYVRLSFRRQRQRALHFPRLLRLPVLRRERSGTPAAEHYGQRRCIYGRRRMRRVEFLRATCIKISNSGKLDTSL